MRSGPIALTLALAGSIVCLCLLQASAAIADNAGPYVWLAGPPVITLIALSRERARYLCALLQWVWLLASFLGLYFIPSAVALSWYAVRLSRNAESKV
jgi:hypothetical protein